jgi:hypothetical protein
MGFIPSQFAHRLKMLIKPCPRILGVEIKRYHSKHSRTQFGKAVVANHRVIKVVQLRVTLCPFLNLAF